MTNACTLAVLAGSCLIVCPALGFGQTDSARPAYEAAEISVNTSGDSGSDTDGSQGQVVMKNLPLKRLIANAYSVTPPQVDGPDWLESVRFDIVAKYPPNSTAENRPLMLRTLLEDRLKLTVHRDSKEMPGYALTVAKSGFKLKPAGPGESSRHSSGGLVRTLVATNTSIPRLAAFLTQTLGRTVVDQTGIAGEYNFELKWTADDLSADTSKNNAPDSEPSLFTELQEKLGLRVQAQKVAVEVIVVDHAERAPSD